MASTFILKRKFYSLLSNGKGKSLSEFLKEYRNLGGKEGTGKTFKVWYRGNLTPKKSSTSRGDLSSKIEREKEKISKLEEINKTRRNKNKSKNRSKFSFRSGYEKGKSTANIIDGIKNTWEDSNLIGRVGIVGTGTSGVYLIGKGMTDKEKNFSILANGSGKSLSDYYKEWKKLGGFEKTKKTFKAWYRGVGNDRTPLTAPINFSKGSLNSAIGRDNEKILEEIRRDEIKRVRRRSKSKESSSFEVGKKKGSKEVGIIKGLKNTVKNSSNLERANLILLGSTGTYYLGKGVKNSIEED